MGAQLLGASVHTALKNWYALSPERRRPEALAALLKGTWVREGYRDDEQERAAYRRALGWLESYVETLDPGVDPLGVERVVAVKTAVLAFNGRTDRIDSRPGPDGPELVIVDYKTGRTGLDADDARGSQALALYAYAAERVFRRPCRRVELHHLPTGTVAAHEHTVESLARQLTRAEESARDIMAAERVVADGGDPDEAFPTTPGPRCGWCDYRRTCPAGRRRRARSRGRPSSAPLTRCPARTDRPGGRCPARTGCPGGRWRSWTRSRTRVTRTPLHRRVLRTARVDLVLVAPEPQWCCGRCRAAPCMRPGTAAPSIGAARQRAQGLPSTATGSLPSNRSPLRRLKRCHGASRDVGNGPSA